jgi:hypothetical protein
VVYYLSMINNVLKTSRKARTSIIKIKEDYRYFTHLPGKESVIPLSRAYLKAFPCKFFVGSDEDLCQVDLKITGPVRGFTHLLHIEKARGEVFGTSQEGYFHFYLYAENGVIYLKLHRGKEVTMVIDNQEKTLRKGESIALLECETMQMVPIKEKISFGCYKKPLLENNIERSTKLYALSQLLPKSEAISLKNPQIHDLLVDLFSPQTKDINHQGLTIPAFDFDRFSLFSTFKKQMREHILKEEGNTLYLLEGKNELPHAGRGISLQTNYAMIDLLWRKKKVIQLIIHPLEDTTLTLVFPMNPESFRVKHHHKEKGKFIDASKPLALLKGHTLLIDRITY